MYCVVQSFLVNNDGLYSLMTMNSNAFMLDLTINSPPSFRTSNGGCVNHRIKKSKRLSINSLFAGQCYQETDFK